MIITISILTLFIRFISSIILIIYLVPLQIKEAKVTNSLKTLRLQLLLIGLILIINNFLAMYVASHTLFILKENTDITITIIQLARSIFYLILSVIIYLIYISQYSEENKKKHIY